MAKWILYNGWNTAFLKIGRSFYTQTVLYDT